MQQSIWKKYIKMYFNFILILIHLWNLDKIWLSDLISLMKKNTSNKEIVKCFIETNMKIYFDLVWLASTNVSTDLRTFFT